MPDIYFARRIVPAALYLNKFHGSAIKGFHEKIVEQASTVDPSWTPKIILSSEWCIVEVFVLIVFVTTC